VKAILAELLGNPKAWRRASIRHQQSYVLLDSGHSRDHPPLSSVFPLCPLWLGSFRGRDHNARDQFCNRPGSSFNGSLPVKI
jgi:hypothetical protein